jgi:hypothetical protein
MTTTEQYTEADFHEVDREALNRALSLTLAERDQDRVAQVKRMLKEDGWYAAASFAAYHRQTDALGLEPWQSPPCAVIENDPQIEAVKLHRRMISYGVSIYDPDPIAAIEARQRRR